MSTGAARNLAKLAIPEKPKKLFTAMRTARIMDRSGVGTGRLNKPLRLSARKTAVKPYHPIEIQTRLPDTSLEPHLPNTVRLRSP